MEFQNGLITSKESGRQSDLAKCVSNVTNSFSSPGFSGFSDENLFSI